MTDPTPTPPAHHLGITLDGDVKERIMDLLFVAMILTQRRRDRKA